MATEGGCLKCGQWNTCKDPPTHPLDKQPYFAWDQSTERSSILETTNKRCWMLGWWCTRSNKMRRAPFIPTAISNSPSRAGTKHTTVSSSGYNALASRMLDQMVRNAGASTKRRG